MCRTDEAAVSRSLPAALPALAMARPRDYSLALGRPRLLPCLAAMLPSYGDPCLYRALSNLLTPLVCSTLLSLPQMPSASQRWRPTLPARPPGWDQPAADEA